MPPLTPDSIRRQTSELWEASGGDPDRCELCDRPLDDSEPWQRGLDGASAHTACLDTFLHRDEEEDRPNG